MVIPIVGVIAAKTIEATKNRLKKEDTLILLAKPTHQLQQRKKEIEEIDDKFKELQKSQNKAAITLIVHGAAACGKTQLARQYGEQYFNQVKSKGNISKLATSNVGIVATLDFRNETSLQQSYSRLVTELGFKCCDERLAVLTAKIQKKFQENPEWLLIVDGLNTEESKLFMSFLKSQGRILPIIYASGKYTKYAWACRILRNIVKASIPTL